MPAFALTITYTWADGSTSTDTLTIGAPDVETARQSARNIAHERLAATVVTREGRMPTFRMTDPEQISRE